jgi:hypothetical protein
VIVRREWALPSLLATGRDIARIGSPTATALSRFLQFLVAFFRPAFPSRLLRVIHAVFSA